eukprot:6194882-Pleurochrysis_carterae.AAC.2
MEVVQVHSRKPLRDPAARRDSRSGVFSAPGVQLGTRSGRKAAAALVTAVEADMGVSLCRSTSAHLE